MIAKDEIGAAKFSEVCFPKLCILTILINNLANYVAFQISRVICGSTKLKSIICVTCHRCENGRIWSQASRTCIEPSATVPYAIGEKYV